MSAGQKLHDLQVQYALHVLGYSNSLQRDVLGFLNDLEKDSIEKLAGRLATIKSKGSDPGPKTTARVQDTIDQIRALTTGVYSKIHDHLEKELIGFAGAEAEHANKAINQVARANVSTNLPSPARLKAIVTERPIHGRILKPWLTGMGEGTANAVEQQIRLGMAAGENVDKIVARVTGTSGFEGSKNSARTLVRTATNSIANAAQQETWKANSDVITGWQFVATLDSKTTIICSAQDGKVYPLGEGPIPPLHPNCRSTTIAVTKPLTGKKYTPETRASMDGQIAAKENFESFLTRKGAEFQDEHLGPVRADLFRRGKLNLSDFVRNYDQVIPLDELRRLHPDAFGGVAPEVEIEPVAPAKPEAPQTFSPINSETTATSIRIERKSALAKSIGQALQRNKLDARYDPRSEFQNIKDTDFGKAAFSSAFTDEAASLVSAILPEVDAVCDAFNVPRLRALRSTAGGNIATMGDGTLSMNATYFNGYAAEVAGTEAGASVAKLIEARDALAAVLTAKRKELDAIKLEIAGLTGVERETTVHRYLDLADAFNIERKNYLKLDKKIEIARTTDRAATKEVSTWAPGDDPATRPFNATDYFDSPLDRARMVIFHEVAHHVHQMTRKVARRALATPPVELELRQLFNDHFFRLGQGFEKKKLVSTTYATKNEFEWFAESFGLYMMGRFDLVDPTLKGLIERLLEDAK